MIKHFLYTFQVLLICLGSYAQKAPMTADQIQVKIDSAQYFEDHLRSKTALHYFESVEPALASLLVASPQNGELWRMDGLVKARTSTPEDAYSSFTTSLLLDSKNLKSQVEYISFTIQAAQKMAAKGKLDTSQKWLQDAYDVCAKALDNHPFHFRLHELAGDIYATTNDIKNCTYHYEMSYKAKKKPETALKLYRLYAVNQDYKNEVKMVGILNRDYRDYAEFYAVQAQLSLENVLADPVENNRYLPGVKETLMKAINLGSQKPAAYRSYFELVKMGYAIDDNYRVDKSEILMVLDIAGEIFVEMPTAKAEILIEGADLLKDLDHDAEACDTYKKAIAIDSSKGDRMTNLYCN